MLTEINRQAASIGLNTGGLNNTNLVTYVGGGDNQADSQVSVDLSGAGSAVDATALGLQSTSVAGGGSELSGALVNLNNNAQLFLTGSSQVFNFNVSTATGSTPVAITVGNGGAGLTGQDVINSLNTSLAQYGISASIANDGGLQFGGSTAFTVTASHQTGTGNVVATQNGTAINTANYSVDSATALNATNTAGGAFAGFVGGAGVASSESVSFPERQRNL